MFIYKITNKVNGKIYVGKTTRQLTVRFKAHIKSSENGSKTKLHNAIRKHGKDNFYIQTIENVNNKNLLNEKEIYYISILSPDYNMTAGGDGGDTSLSINYKQNHSYKCLRGECHPRFGKFGELSPNYGLKHKQLTIEIMSNTHNNLRKTKRIICEYCNKDVDFANHSRWHGHNCKNYKENPLNESSLISSFTPPEI